MNRHLLIFLCAAMIVSGTTTASGQAQRVGLYSDAAGSGCSLTDTSPGFFQVFLVVLNPDDITAVEFQVLPDPEFTAVVVGELSPLPQPGVDGDVYSGIVLTFGDCYATPLHAYTITYQGFGTSGNCAALDIGPNPRFNRSTIVFSSCLLTQIEVPASAVDPFYINPDGSCPCGLPIPVETSTWGQIKALYR